MISLIKVSSPQDLPSDWDNYCTSYFQTREFLNHCQIYNPCKQRYYILKENSRFLCGAIVYTLRLDILTYLGIPSPLKMKVSGIPCSVSSSGIIGNEDSFGILINHLLSIEKGFLLYLNSDNKIASAHVAHGRTWPTIILEHNFKSFDSYIASLRSEYRRRIKQIDTFCYQVSFHDVPMYNFSDIHYQQYRNVHSRSKGKLETLNIDFFKNLPQCFNLTEIHYNNRLVGWTIANYYKETCSFFLGGQDYAVEPRMVYLAKLHQIIKKAITKGYFRIDLGQSAEVPKMRFGGIVTEKYMAAHHSNWLINKIVCLSSGLLSYNTTFPTSSVFIRKPV